MAVEPQVYYYYKQDTNQVLAGAAGNSITNVAGMNALLTSSKVAVPLTDPLTIAKIKSIGQAITYKSDVVYNSASAGYTGIEGFEIPIQDDQELWVYRGIQPVNTVPSNTPSNAGPGDSNHTQYNAYLHRPYKLYMLTETGSGIGSKPWLPFGNFYGESTGQGVGTNFVSQYNVKQLAVVGNLDYPNNNFLISESKASGSVTIFGDTQEVRPWVGTSYNSMGLPPAVGSAWRLFCETSSTANYMQETKPVGDWLTATNLSPGAGQYGANNASPAATTKLAISKMGIGFGYQNQIINAVSASGNLGKPKGKIRFQTQGNPLTRATYDVGDIDTTTYSAWTIINVSNGTSTGPWPPSNLTDVSMSMDGPMLVADILQQQGAFANIIPNFSNEKLRNGVFSYTSSTFDTTSADGTAASGSSQFGFYTQQAQYVEYKATVESVNSGDVTVTYTGSTGVPNFSTCSPGFNITFVAAAGTVSSSGDDSSSTYTLSLTSPSASGTPIGDIYSTRISDVYLSLSSSLSQSIDGLYIFNQLPSQDIEVTASMFLNAWTGSDAVDAPKYGSSSQKSSNLNTTYSISPNPPLYGEGEAGDGPTWPTASINIYKGNYPNNTPKEGDVPVHTETFKSPDIHISGLAITTSFLLTSQSLSFQDCLKMSLKVESGSYASESIENSLIVSEYQLEFKNAAELEGGDGRVPTFIDNAFKGTGGFSNAPDCQPMLNNVVQERNNDKIQLVEYQTDPYDPSNFQLILSGTAARSTVPESNYTQEPWLNPRYIGSQTTAYEYNSIVGLEGGYGKSPVIEYKRAYLAYCDQVIDPYPVVNSKTQFNILYMINGGGDALNPLISPYTAYDVLGTWDNGGQGQVGINQISGSSQFDALNGYQETFKVGQQAIPLLYSQTSANTFAIAIPIAGNAEQVSNVTSSFIEYDMSSQGSSKLAAYTDAYEVLYYNIAQGIASQTGQIYPQTPGTFQGTQFNIESGSGFGVQRGNPDVDGVIELPIITASIGSYTAPTNVYGDQYFGNPGEIFFTTDPLGSGSGDLSDDYMIRGTFVLPSTAPSRYKIKKFVKKRNKKKTKYKSGTVGKVQFVFESTTQTNLSLGDSSWNKESFQWLADASSTGQQEPTMTFYFGELDGVADGRELVVPLANLSDNVGFVNDIYTFDVEANDIENYVNAQGTPFNKVQYVTYNFAFQSDTSLQSNKRYRFRAVGQYDEETGAQQTGEPQRNRFNPSYLPQFSDGASGGSQTDPVSYSTPFPSSGPYVSMNVIGNQVASSLQSNALNFPYWDFVTSNQLEDTFLYYNNISDPDSNGWPYLVDAPTNPGSGRIFWTEGSGSLNQSNQLIWESIGNQGSVTVTQPNSATLIPDSTTGKGDLNAVTFDISSNSTQILDFTLNNASLSQGGFKDGDVLTWTILSLETAGFGTVSGDLTITLTPQYINENRRGASSISINKTDSIGTQGIALYLDRIIAIGSSNDQGAIQIGSATNSNQFTGSIANVTDNTTFYTVFFNENSTNAGNVSTSGNVFTNNNTSALPMSINFTTGSQTGDVTLENTVIELSSSNGNNNYGLGYYQGYLPYTASSNNNFPGGFEPQDTAWPLPNVPYAFRINDEIRFQNDERFAYKITKVLSPEQNFMINGRNKLQLTVDKPIQASVDLNFFLIRRYIAAPNSVIVNRVFPYGSLPTIKEFVPSTNQILSFDGGSGASGSEASGSTTIMEQSGSFIEYIKPLLKSDNTPTGILKPEFPVTEIDVTPDEIIRDLRDKKLIE
tara:strand:- start:1457 stop:6739 length:5283 start_codon:yes stop_codon:yes gene_type:complete